MSYSFQKYYSLEGSPTNGYTANGLNRMNFKVDEVSGLTDIGKSYLLFDVSITQTDKKKDGTPIPDVVNPWRWGYQGTKYNASALVRNIRIDSNKGTLENVINQNILTNTLGINYLSSKSVQKSQDILNFYSGASCAESSLFNNSPWLNYSNAAVNGVVTPTPTSATVVFPMQESALGLARIGPVNLRELEHENLALRLELENQNTILDLAWDSTTNIDTGLGAGPVFNSLAVQEQFTASYQQTVGEAPVYILKVDRPVNWKVNKTATPQAAYPFGQNASINSLGFLNISYTDSNGALQNYTVAYDTVTINDPTTDLNILTQLQGANNLNGDGGISGLCVKAPVCGNVATATPTQVTVQIPHPVGAVNHCPFLVGQTVALYGQGLSVAPINTASNGQTYQIIGIAQTTLNTPAGGANLVDEFVLTLDSALTFSSETPPGNVLVFMFPSPQASAAWSIATPQLALASVNETPDQKARRTTKMKGTKTSFTSYELESFSWGNNASNFQRQWILNPNTMAALLFTPLNGSLLSVRDNANQLRVILNGTQLTNRPILIDNRSAGSQYTDWLKSILETYCGYSVKQLQQIPPDQPESVMLVPAPIMDPRFSDMDEKRSMPHILEYQLFSPTSQPMSAKSWYVFKLVIKDL
jgi:hypothetical protein